ncbi:hypothetical protein NC796_09065 [Aliifodinibius sp. S!AR15-10]|uniref:hypothetical protein n=1 Tax=Aliifodinibius sp. S!AR15-10 TaxID=2950437 RepID=UPI002862E1B3|nr:hypothetical protein [Aliifodinibius sp. S!AR15-10]MDR8391285.1 hypothetical protein [Aliifodinibius sp. S!AR15-10]
MIKNTILIITALGLALSLYYYTGKPTPSDKSGEKYQEVFESKIWRQGTERQKGAMVEYILKSDTLRGLQDTEIMLLLGRADQIHNNCFYYHVDLGRSRTPDGNPTVYNLAIDFDSTGRAMEVDLAD